VPLFLVPGQRKRRTDRIIRPSNPHCRVRSRAGSARRSEPLTGRGKPDTLTQAGRATSGGSPRARPAARTSPPTHSRATGDSRTKRSISPDKRLDFGLAECAEPVSRPVANVPSAPNPRARLRRTSSPCTDAPHPRLQRMGHEIGHGDRVERAIHSRMDSAILDLTDDERNGDSQELRCVSDSQLLRSAQARRGGAEDAFAADSGDRDGAAPSPTRSSSRKSAQTCNGFGSSETATWWPGAESNHRHADFQSAALPTELPGRTLNYSDAILAGFTGPNHACCATGRRRAA
jgi:hypothetical protein